MGGWTIEPYVGAGAAFAFGDLNTVSTNQFTGASDRHRRVRDPGGTAVAHDRAAKRRDRGASGRPVTIGLGAETRLSDRQRDGRLELHLRLGF